MKDKAAYFTTKKSLKTFQKGESIGDYPMFLNSLKRPTMKTEDDWRKELSELEYHVLRKKGTERPFTGEYYTHAARGVYHCRACGEALFSSEHKYHTGCGWPSFWGELETASIKQVRDYSHGMQRIELCCASCESHLGHIFDDGPAAFGGKRYCINSVCLRFAPEKQG